MTRLASDQLRRNQDGGKTEDDDLCAICLSGFNDENPKFHLDCNHAFHGKCIITSLRYKTWCPTCKDDPKRKDREEEEEEEGNNDSDVEHTKQRMLKKLKTETIKSILRDCNEPTHGNRATLAEEAAMMLTMTSDEESDGEENENDEQGDDEPDTLGEWVASINEIWNARRSHDRV